MPHEPMKTPGMPKDNLRPTRYDSDSEDVAADYINQYGPDGLNTVIKQGPSEDAGASPGKMIQPSEVKH